MDLKEYALVVGVIACICTILNAARGFVGSTNTFIGYCLFGVALFVAGCVGFIVRGVDVAKVWIAGSLAVIVSVATAFWIWDKRKKKKGDEKVVLTPVGQLPTRRIEFGRSNSVLLKNTPGIYAELLEIFVPTKSILYKCHGIRAQLTFTHPSTETFKLSGWFVSISSTGIIEQRPVESITLDSKDPNRTWLVLYIRTGSETYRFPSPTNMPFDWLVDLDDVNGLAFGDWDIDLVVTTDDKQELRNSVKIHSDGFTTMPLRKAAQKQIGETQKQNEDSVMPKHPISTPLALHSVHELFVRDFQDQGGVLGSHEITSQKGTQIKLESKFLIDPNSASNFISFYVARSEEAYDACHSIAFLYRELIPWFRVWFEGVGPDGPQSTKAYVFTGRMYIYHEDLFSLEQIGDLTRLFAEQKLKLILRGQPYLREEVIRYSGSTP